MSNPLQRFTTSGLLADRKVTQLMVFAVLVFTVEPTLIVDAALRFLF